MHPTGVMFDFVPPEFQVPALLVSEGYRLEPLGPEHLSADHAAVVASATRLRGLFGPDSPWPPAGLDLEEDLRDLQAHREEFDRRSSFAYTVLAPDRERCLGCLYIYPSTRADYEAEVYYWVEESEYARGGDERLGALVRAWLAREWPFSRVAWPGRDIPWTQWRALAPSARALAGLPLPPGL